METIFVRHTEDRMFLEVTQNFSPTGFPESGRFNFPSKEIRKEDIRSPEDLQVLVDGYRVETGVHNLSEWFSEFGVK